VIVSVSVWAPSGIVVEFQPHQTVVPVVVVDMIGVPSTLSVNVFD
jgi:hypothetical protein